MVRGLTKVGDKTEVETGTSVCKSDTLSGELQF